MPIIADGQKFADHNNMTVATASLQCLSSTYEQKILVSMLALSRTSLLIRHFVAAALFWPDNQVKGRFNFNMSCMHSICLFSSDPQCGLIENSLLKSSKMILTVNLWMALHPGCTPLLLIDFDICLVIL